MIYIIFGGDTMAETTGELIKKYRLLKKLTQKQLGDLCNMKDSAIRRYEANRAKPKIDTLKKIAEALDVEWVCLLDRNNFNIEPGKGWVFDFESGDIIPYDTERIDLTDRAKLIDTYDNLNELGKKEALKRVEELTEIKKYIEE